MYDLYDLSNLFVDLSVGDLSVDDLSVDDLSELCKVLKISRGHVAVTATGTETAHETYKTDARYTLYC